MSTQGIESVLSRAMSDAAFADLLFANPEEPLAGFELTPEEAASLKDLSMDDWGKMAQASLEERKSFGWSNHNQNLLKVRK